MQFIKTVLCLLAVYATLFKGCYSDANQLRADKMLGSDDDDRLPSIRFRVTGNVYPDGYYYVTMNLGNPPKPYALDIDTGSHLTWLQCDAPCRQWLPAPHLPYTPVTRQRVTCSDPLCEAVHAPERPVCNHPDDQCDYYIRYADYSSSQGIVIKDPFPLQYTNGTTTKPDLAFGCGYHQSHPDPNHRPWVDGILGLGLGKEGILSQLRDLAVVRNILGLCLGERGGYLFFGNEVPSGVVWTPMVTTTELSKRYYLGLAELFVDGYESGIKDLRVVFDSGTSFSFFSPEAYNFLLSRLKIDVKDSLYISNDETLPVCWRGLQAFSSIEQIKHIFKPIVLSFQNPENTWFEMDPEAYLIISEHGSVCLGILNSEHVGAPHINLIGDISFRDKLIIYDNENQRIGWVSEKCNPF